MSIDAELRKHFLEVAQERFELANKITFSALTIASLKNSIINWIESVPNFPNSGKQVLIFYDNSLESLLKVLHPAAVKLASNNFTVYPDGRTENLFEAGPVDHYYAECLAPLLPFFKGQPNTKLAFKATADALDRLRKGGLTCPMLDFVHDETVKFYKAFAVADAAYTASPTDAVDSAL